MKGYKMNAKTIATYRAKCEAQGFDWADYCDCDEWTLSMLFDTWEEEDEDY